MDIKKFLDSLGVPAELAKELLSETPTEGFDFNAAIEAYNTARKAVWLKKLEPEITQTVDSKFNGGKKTLAKALVDAFSLDITKTKAYEDGFETTLEFAKTVIADRVKEASTASDESLKQQVEDWKTKFTNVKKAKEKMEEEHPLALQAAKDAAQIEINGFKLGNVFQKSFKKLEYGANKGMVSLFENGVEAEIREKYVVDLEGNIFDKDGTSIAVARNGEGTYTSLDQAVADYASEYGVLKKSNLDPDKPGPDDKNKGGDSEAVKRMKARFEAQKKQAV